METTYLAYGIIYPWNDDFNNLFDSAAEKLTDYQKRRLLSGWDVWDDETYESLEDYERDKLDQIDLEKMSDYLNWLGRSSIMDFMQGYLAHNYPRLNASAPQTAIPLVIFSRASQSIINGSNGVLYVNDEDKAELTRFLDDHNTEAEHQAIFWTEKEYNDPYLDD